MSRFCLLALLGAGIVLPGSLAASSFVNFESGHVRPLCLSPSGAFLFSVNTPDNRLQVFETSAGTLLPRGEVVVGLEPVAVAARTDSEVFVVNHLSDSISVVDASDPDRPFVKATLLTGDEPRDVVLGGPRRSRIFVTAARRGQNRPGEAGLTTPGAGRADVWVFDAERLEAPPHIVGLACDVPRALAVSPDGRRVHAAAFLSGNRTTVLNEGAVQDALSGVIGDGFDPPPAPPPFRNAAGLPAPRTGTIVHEDESGRWRDAAGQDWTPRVRFRLPDNDVFTIDAEADPPAVIAQAGGAGTVLFNLAVSPADGRIYASNLELKNAIRFEPDLRGRFVENCITIIGGGSVRPVHLNQHIDYEIAEGSEEERDLSLALPGDLAFNGDGSRLYVSALGSGKLGVLDPEGRVLDRIAVSDNPTGVAVHDTARRLYVLDRLFHLISVVDMDSHQLVEQVPLRYTPESVRLREGRQYLYDARQASAHGDAACASCHIFADSDGLAWDLGDPDGDEASNPLEPSAPFAGEALPAFHPMKGPMMTQSLRGLAGAGAMHWRGDRNGGAEAVSDDDAAFMSFHPVFQSLLGLSTPFPMDNMRKLRDFVLSLRYPPNPVAPLDGSLTTEQALGREIFLSPGDRAALSIGGSGCTDCHKLPVSTSGLGAIRGEQSFKVPHLRNLYQKVGMFGYALPNVVSASPRRLAPVPTPFLGDQARGFGFSHDGSVPSIVDLLLQPTESFTFTEPAGRSLPEIVRALEAFLLAFPTGLAPAVGQQASLSASGLEASLVRFELLRARAAAGDGDLVVHGLWSGVQRGWLYDRGSDGELAFAGNRAGERVSASAMISAAREGRAVLTATLVPPGSGRRIGIDRDEDGALDQDEIDLGFNPADPVNRPPLAGSRIVTGDCNADIHLDVSDAAFTLNYLFLGGETPDCGEACDASGDARLDVSDAVYTLRFLFQGGAPPGRYPDCDLAAEQCSETCATDPGR